MWACNALETCVLDATSTIDSINDLDLITIIWDLDISVDSNGDGIKDNDVDKIGKRIDHVFNGTRSLARFRLSLGMRIQNVQEHKQSTSK